MFTPEVINARIQQQPFVPLRIITSAGEKVDVYHPDLVIVGRRDLIVGIASSKNPSIYEQVTRLAIMHITALEDLPVAPKTDGNGQS